MCEFNICSLFKSLGVTFEVTSYHFICCFLFVSENSKFKTELKS